MKKIPPKQKVPTSLRLGRSFFCSLSISYSYIRVKRRNQTFCLLCNNSDSVQTVKEQLAMAAKQHLDNDAVVDANDMRLLYNGSVLQDDETLQDFKDDSVLHVVFKVADNEYEPVDIVSTDLQEG